MATRLGTTLFPNVTPPRPAESLELQRSFETSPNQETTLTLKLSYFTWYVHPEVLSRKSEFFRTICSGDWRESQEQLIQLHDDDPWVFARMLQFLYYGRMTLDPWDSQIAADQLGISIVNINRSGRGNPAFNVDMLQHFDVVRDASAEIDLELYDLADKYGIPSLREYALHSLRSAWNHYDSLIHHLFADHHPDRLNQDPGLKDVLARNIATIFNDIVDTDQWSNGVGKWMKEDWELTTMVMKHMSREIKRLGEELETERVASSEGISETASVGEPPTEDLTSDDEPDYDDSEM